MNIVDLDKIVEDDIVLTTARGIAEPLAASVAEAGLAPNGVRTGATSVRMSYRDPLGQVAALPLFRSLAIDLGEFATANPEIIVSLLRRSQSVGVLSGLALAPIRFRVSRTPLTPNLIQALSSELSWVNAPSHWDINLEVVDGRLVGEVGALFRTRRFGVLTRVRASTPPVVAAYAARLLKVPSGGVVLDPFCGAGTTLVEVARTMGSACVVGFDLSPEAVQAARDNLKPQTDQDALFSLVPPAAIRVEQADARQLPLADGAVDRVIANLPFGKQIGRHRENADLYRDSLAEMRRVTRPDGRMVLITEDKRHLRAALPSAGLKSIRESVVEVGGLFPTIFVITAVGRRRAARRS